MIPQVGQKLDIKPARVVRVEQQEAIYGPIKIVTFKDKRGNLFKWVTETEPEWALHGRLVPIRATVKREPDESGLIEIKRVVRSV